jgi:hypothetical protein
LSDDSVTVRRERSCPACGLTFIADRRRVWCSNACRQRGYRLRCQPPADTLVVLPVPLPKTAVVYVCPECDTRYVGVQRCELCHVFCRRAGPGGPCPHCDEPVVVTDLIPGATAR